MGSSCTSGKKHAKKPRTISNTNTTHSSPKQNNDVPLVFYEHIMKENFCNNEELENKAFTNKTLQKYLSAAACTAHELKSNKSSTSTNYTISSKQTVKASQPSITHTQSESNVQQKRKVNQLENFILERKKYMQERGVAVYTPYTVLPPPILKSVGSSSLQKKRFNSLKEVSLKTIYQNRKRSYPTNMLSGDVDSVIVEV